jgi:hypothetical protein
MRQKPAENIQEITKGLIQKPESRTRLKQEHTKIATNT